MNCNLYTTFYREPRLARAQELLTALELNRSVFDRVRILSERVPCDTEECVESYEIYPGMIEQISPRGNQLRIQQERQKYSDLLNWASDAGPDDITIIANCDIVFPVAAVEQIIATLKPGEVYALSRYENGRLHDTAWSQDAWAFRGAPPINCGGYYFGVPGVDNHFAHELDEIGYRVLNPSRSIKTIHLHASQQRTNTNHQRHRVEPPYLLIRPHRLGEEPTYRRVPTTEQLDRELRGKR